MTKQVDGRKHEEARGVWVPLVGEGKRKRKRVIAGRRARKGFGRMVAESQRGVVPRERGNS